MAAATPGEEGILITEYLLNSLSNPDNRAALDASYLDPEDDWTKVSYQVQTIDFQQSLLRPDYQHSSALCFYDGPGVRGGAEIDLFRSGFPKQRASVGDFVLAPARPIKNSMGRALSNGRIRNRGGEVMG